MLPPPRYFGQVIVQGLDLTQSHYSEDFKLDLEEPNYSSSVNFKKS